MVSLTESDVKNIVSNEQFIKDYNEYKKHIDNIDFIKDKSFENNINLIWTNTMVFIKKYILIFEKYSNI